MSVCSVGVELIQRPASFSADNSPKMIPERDSFIHWFIVRSPMTPTRLSRIQEKDALVGLNDRLAAYIERNQQLEQENQFYSKQVKLYNILHRINC